MPNQPDLDPTVVIPLPQRTLAALDALENAGFETWIVGGYVRDALLGRPSSDIDIATQAHWQDVQRVFEGQGYRTHETGTAHGTLTVIVDEQALEVTTYRSDGAYADARHPNQVSFVRTIAEDLARRDFTMNALAYHPARGLFDPYGGHADLEARIIRAVGDPDRRFSEDALRMLRACRFAAELGFAIDPNTFEGMLANKGLLPRISTERITHELQRLLLGEHAGRALTATVDVLAAVLPELVAMKGFEQRTPYHIYDVLEHTARVLDGVPPYPLVRWAALFHDMGKPAAFFTDEGGTGHFYGHAAISVMLARGIMDRLELSSAFAAQVLTLVERHDDVIDRTPKAVKRAFAPGRQRRAVRRPVRPQTRGRARPGASLHRPRVRCRRAGAHPVRDPRRRRGVLAEEASHRRSRRHRARRAAGSPRRPRLVGCARRRHGRAHR